MFTQTTKIRPGLASVEAVKSTFSRYRNELEWIAYFITGDELMATACVADACALTLSTNTVFEDWLLHWARHATTRAAVQMLGIRIKELARTHEGKSCSHKAHPPLDAEDLELVMSETEYLISKLDVASRCALVLCGIERRRTREVALLVGVPDLTVISAYCSALQALEVLRCERLQAGDERIALCH